MITRIILHSEPEESYYQGLKFYVAKKKRVVRTQNIKLLKSSKTGQNPEPINNQVEFSEILIQNSLEIAIAKNSHNGNCTVIIFLGDHDFWSHYTDTDPTCR